MPRPQTIYSLKGIFTDLLGVAEKINFIIPTYQRGYKWTSSEENSQVRVLMNDLNLAAERGNERYYLQFITLKEKEQNFEVIDGQQRLVTLTIIFSLLFNFEELRGEENFIAGKIIYQIRNNFIQKYIYNNIELILESKTWGDFISRSEDSNNQDVFYIYQAVRTIHNYLLKINKRKFYDYISEKTLLIVNLLENNINSEKIFINVNKGIKLKDEDLVKGLLITKIPLENKALTYRLTEIEINEIRANLGRQWDDLTHWVSQEEVRNFYKSVYDKDNRLNWLIKLAYPQVSSDKINPNFYYLNKLYDDSKESAIQIFSKIRSTMLTLNDWYFEPEEHNLLGFILHTKSSIGLTNLWSEFSNCGNKREFLTLLKNNCKRIIPFDYSNNGIKKDLNYVDNVSDLFNLFLIIDIAKFLPIDGRKAIPYDFGKIFVENWSIEHIYPQNEKDMRRLTNLTKADMFILKELFTEELQNFEIEDENKRQITLDLLDKIRSSDQGFTINDDERKALVYLLENKANDLHKLGNLCLLPQGINSSLSDHFFDRKRTIIVQKVSDGNFVPFHTYDVFSKLIIGNDTNLYVWSRSDLLKHEEYINCQINKIVDYLNIN